MKMKAIFFMLLSVATLLSNAQKLNAVQHRVSSLPPNITALHPVSTVTVTVGTDTNGVVFAFPQGFIPVGLMWSDTLGNIYTYTKSDSIVFKPYPLFTTVLTTADAIGAQKFEATWNVLKILNQDTSATGIGKFNYDTYAKQWYAQSFLKSALWTGKTNSANWRWFVKTVYVTGYFSNQDY